MIHLDLRVDCIRLHRGQRKNCLAIEDPAFKHNIEFVVKLLAFASEICGIKFVSVFSYSKA